jgi:DNA-binding NtrC family response regulator
MLVPAPHSDPPAIANPQRVLIVEDMEDTRITLQQVLQLSLGLEVDLAADGAEGLAMLERRPYSLVITDLRMPRLGGMEMIEIIKARRLPVTIIVTTGHGSIAQAVEAMRHGAYDFLTKPPDPQHLCLIVQRALRERSLVDEVTTLRDQLQGRHRFQNVISKSPKMHDVFELIGHVSDTNSTTLIVGETGTGKEQVARAVHLSSSHRRSGPFVAVNCAAIPETLLEAELFGSEKGAYTGSERRRVGRFEQAHTGTLFLDEVGDIPLGMQVKLLRVLQDRCFERLGGGEHIEVDVRVIAATHQNLDKLVREGKFREDLYYRLNVVRMELPPLRERLEDVPILAAHFAQKYARNGHKTPEIIPEAMKLLMTYHWPGNVRQLENALERACITARDGIIQPSDLPAELLTEATPSKPAFHVDLSRPLHEQIAEMNAAFEERYLRKALKRTRGHVGKCAEISGLSRRSITDKIVQYGIDKAEFKID